MRWAAKGSRPESRTPWGRAVAEVATWLAQAPRAALLELTSRLGFAARGVVYLSVGVLAVLAALGLTPRAQGAVEAMAGWGRWPAGLVFIWLIAAGLMAFTVWRGLQALLDADGHGRSPKGIMVRLGQAVSGVAHGVLAWSLWGVLDGLEDLNQGDDIDAAQAAARALLATPHGDLLLVAGGAGILAFAAGGIGQGLFQDFAKRLGCSPRACRWAGALARVGYVGRGLATAPMGGFLIVAGLNARAGEARDFGAALQALAALPLGHAALGLAGLGLMAFGAFAVFEAGWRRIEPPVAA